MPICVQRNSADDEYEQHVSWGHSSIGHAVTFATLAGVPHLVGFHHDPGTMTTPSTAVYEYYADGALRIQPARAGATLAGVLHRS